MMGSREMAGALAGGTAGAVILMIARAFCIWYGLL